MIANSEMEIARQAEYIAWVKKPQINLFISNNDEITATLSVNLNIVHSH